MVVETVETVEMGQRSVRFFSPTWADEVKDRFNAPPSREYRATKLELYWDWIANARASFNGSVAIGVIDLPERADPVWVLLTFEHGVCVRAALAESNEEPQATFALAATFGNWKTIMAGYDTSRALMGRMLRLVSGDPYEFYKLVFFFTEALASIAQIPCVFPEAEAA
jgi:hypothetical protein